MRRIVILIVCLGIGLGVFLSLTDWLPAGKYRIVETRLCPLTSTKELVARLTISKDPFRYAYITVSDWEWRGDCTELEYLVTRTDWKWRVVVDGKRGPEYDSVGDLIFSSNGSHVMYTARKGYEHFVVLDGKEYDNLENLVFSPDGKRIVYEAQRAKARLVVVDGRPGSQYDMDFRRKSGHQVYNR